MTELPATPAANAARAARQHGIDLPDAAAADVAAAVLGCHDTKVAYRQHGHRDQWAHADFREQLRATVRRQLFIEAADKGLIPVAPPKETLKYLSWMPYGDDVEVLADLAESGDAAWETVEVTLSMPARKAV